MLNALWGVSGVCLGAQALLYTVLLVWPLGFDLDAAIERFDLWERSGIVALQIFVMLPLLSLLAWTLRTHRQAQVLVSVAFLGVALLAVSGWIEMHAIAGAIRESVDAQDRLRGVAFLRCVEFAVALSAAIMVRLAWRARRI